ncbi:MAG: hypothetical protein AAFS10_14065 [Myxococcota bacterium]
MKKNAMVILLVLASMWITSVASAEIIGCSIAKQNEFKGRCQQMGGSYNNDCSYNTNNHLFTYSCTLNGQVKRYNSRDKATKTKARKEKGDALSE